MPIMPKSSSNQRRQARAAVKRLLLPYRRVRDQQESFLRTLLRRNAQTVFGRLHGFASVKTAQDYQRQVPIQNWRTLESLVDRICRGEKNVLTAEPVVLLHQTNGTTGKNKLIPVTTRCNRLQALGYRIWVYKALLDNPGMLRNKVVGIVSARFAGRVQSGLPFGYVSGNVFASRMPAFVRRAYTCPYDVMEIPDPEARRYILMRLALRQDCSFVFTGNPRALLLLFELADRCNAPTPAPSEMQSAASGPRRSCGC